MPLDLQGVEPAHAYDLGKTSAIIFIGFGGYHLSSAIGTARIDADELYLSLCRTIP